MKFKAILKFLMIVGLITSIVSCSGSSSKTHSSVTGWKYNDKNGTGFTVSEGVKTKVPPGMVAIEGGSYTIGERNEYVTTPRNNPKRRITVRSFYMDQYEIRTVDWREYTTWMEVVFKNVAPELVNKVRPDDTVWRDELAYNDPYIAYYFSHPSFNEYPVVGVTWEQAVDFCTWRTDRVNELALVNAGVIDRTDFASLGDQSDYDEITQNFIFNTQKYLYQDSYLPTEGKKTKQTIFGEPRKVNMSDGILFPDFRLPTEAEWEFAAYAVKATEEDRGLVIENQVFPWEGTQMRNKDKKHRGMMMANFVRGRGDMMGTSGALNDKATMTAPVNWYYPNNFGLYNMAGNVNEWVLDVYRPTTFDEATEYNSFRGNVYTTYIADGTDENGQTLFRVDSLGRLEKAPITDGDKRNFKDGDPMSQLFTDFPLLTDTTNVSTILSKNVSIDPTDVLAPKVGDKTRVYKGGSWKDRIYWLNPSSRRYLEQDQATNDIGFRCAMSMIGEADI